LIVLESGDGLLLENGDHLVLEDASATPTRNLAWVVRLADANWSCEPVAKWRADTPATKWDTERAPA
jgi:hypothetical protein